MGLSAEKFHNGQIWNNHKCWSCSKPSRVFIQEWGSIENLNTSNFILANPKIQNKKNQAWNYKSFIPNKILFFCFKTIFKLFITFYLTSTITGTTAGSLLNFLRHKFVIFFLMIILVSFKIKFFNIFFSSWKYSSNNCFNFHQLNQYTLGFLLIP